jgi:hypothetical protein
MSNTNIKLNPHATVATVAIPSNKLNNFGFVDGMTLRLTRANGGWILIHESYDITTHNSNQDIYIITDEQDMGQRIGEIITIIELKK